MDVCGCNHDSTENIDNEDDDFDDDEEMALFPRTAEQREAFKRLALELETDAKLVTLAGWRPYTRPRDLRKTFVSFLHQTLKTFTSIWLKSGPQVL